jgi:hypothetical protein
MPAHLRHDRGAVPGERAAAPRPYSDLAPKHTLNGLSPTDGRSLGQRSDRRGGEEVP